jgi:hypothetical protein
VTAVGVLVLAVSVGLAGCTPAPTGRSATATEQQIESIPGVEKAAVNLNAGHDGFVSRPTVGITVTVSDGYHIGDADAAIVWLAREAWSTGSGRPAGIWMTLEDTSGKPLDWGWKDALTKRGWDDTFNDDGMSSGNVLGFVDPRMASLTGTSWPGPVLQAPPNLFVKN